MPNKLFFSVVIPLYNKAPHVSRSVGSVLNQTFGDFELIIVNDASTDGSVEEVLKFNDPRIRLLHRDEPGPGGYAARNLGIKEAQGEWVAFLDADDEWYPEHLEKMQALSLIFADIYFMSCGWQTYINGKKTDDFYFKHYQSKGLHVLSPKDYLLSCLSQMQPVWTSISCVKKSSPITRNLFPADTEAKRGGDRYAWLKMIFYHKKMAWSDHIGAIYFRDSLNMVTKTAPGCTYLVSQILYQELSENLAVEERNLLTKYFNKQLRILCFENILKNGQHIKFRDNIYWKGDMCNALLLLAVSFVPAKFLKSLHSFKTWLKN